MNIFVGNLNYATTEDALRAAFETYGEIDSVKIIYDYNTGRSRGFGFVEMSDDAEANAAIAALDGTEVDSRQIKVNESRPRTDRRSDGRPPRRSNW